MSAHVKDLLVARGGEGARPVGDGAGRGPPRRLYGVRPGRRRVAPPRGGTWATARAAAVAGSRGADGRGGRGAPGRAVRAGVEPGGPRLPGGLRLDPGRRVVAADRPGDRRAGAAARPAGRSGGRVVRGRRDRRMVDGGGGRDTAGPARAGGREDGYEPLRSGVCPRSDGGAVDGGPRGPGVRRADGRDLPRARDPDGAEVPALRPACLPRLAPGRRVPRGVRAPRRLRLRRRQAAWDEARAVDAPRDLHPERDRDHPVLHPARPDPRTAPACGTLARKGHAFCAGCGAAVRPACPQCRQPIETGWRNCARCGAALTGASPRPTATP